MIYSISIRKRKNAGGKCSCCDDIIYNGERFYHAPDGKYCKRCLPYANRNNPIDDGELGVSNEPDDKKIYAKIGKGFKPIN